MRRSRSLPAVALLAAVALTGLAGCSTTNDERGRLTMEPATELPALQSAGLQESWRRQLPLEPGERIKKAWRTGTSVWVTTSNCRILRLNARSGVLAWNVALGEENFEIYRPIELKDAKGKATGQVLVVTRGMAFIFNIESGDEIRHGSLGISVSADPVVIGDDLCAGGADTFYGLYMDRLGAKHWRIPAPGDFFVAAPVAVDNDIIIGSRDGHLWRVSVDTGKWTWKDRKTNGIISGGLAADRSAVYVPCEDQRVYAFRSDTGAEMWEKHIDGRLDQTPVLASPDVLVTAADRTLYALARADGDIQWNLPGVDQIATVSEDSAWIGDTSGYLRQVALDTGNVKAAAPTSGIQLFVRNRIDDNVLLITHAGLVGMYAPIAPTVRPAPGDAAPAPAADTAPATAPTPDSAPAPAAPAPATAPAP